MKINSLRLDSVIVISSIATATLSIAATAQESQVANGPAREAGKPSLQDVGWQAGVNSGYVVGNTAKFQGTHVGDSDAFNIGIDASTRIPLSDEWFLRLGLASDNFYLDQVTGAPIPEDIHTLRLNTGLGYRLNEQWTITGVMSPSLYRFEDVGGGDIGISGGVLVKYQMRPTLVWTFGIIGAPDSDLKVLPVVGVRWTINDRYDLEVGMPKSRLTYHLDSKWSLYGGLDMNGTTFRTSDTLGTKTGFPAYNHALATYRDIRLGVGAGYEVMRGLRAEVETGFSVFREIDYTKIDEQVKFDPAPYIRFGVRF